MLINKYRSAAIWADLVNVYFNPKAKPVKAGHNQLCDWSCCQQSANHQLPLKI